MSFFERSNSMLAIIAISSLLPNTHFLRDTLAKLVAYYVNC